MMSLRTPLVRFLHMTNYLTGANYSTLPPEIVVFADDGTAVCWHPEKPFPYECSKPLPEVKTDDSVLKVGKKDEDLVFRRKKLNHDLVVAEDLAKIAFTTKHRWFPRKRDKKKRPNESNRPYL